VQDKTEGGQPVRTPRRLSGLILGFVASWSRNCGIGRSRASEIEINDHRPGEIRGTEFGLPPSNMKGAFGNEGALLFYLFASHKDFVVKFDLDHSDAFRIAT
jgi:hypothetical protein